MYLCTLRLQCSPAKLLQLCEGATSDSTLSHPTALPLHTPSLGPAGNPGGALNYIQPHRQLGQILGPFLLLKDLLQSTVPYPEPPKMQKCLRILVWLTCLEQGSFSLKIQEPNPPEAKSPCCWVKKSSITPKSLVPTK